MSTATASITHLRRGVLDIRFALPMVLAILVATPIGAWASQFVPHALLTGVFVAFLLVAAVLLLIPRRPTLVQNNSIWPLLAIGGTVGVISGMLGVVAVAAIIGGYLGATILNRGLNAAQVKKLIALLLLALAAKMLIGLIG